MSTPPVPPADHGVPSSGDQPGDQSRDQSGDQPRGLTDRSPDLEPDPTGIRALLSALPDPGPMPDDLVARITASIAHEQSARGQGEGAGGTVVPLRRRSWGWQHLGAAAAAAVVLAVGVPALLTGTGPGDVMAALGGSSSNDSASGAAASLESAGDSAGDSAGSGAQPSPPTDGNTVAPRSQPSSSGDLRVRGAIGNVRLAATGTAYTKAGLATQAAALGTAVDTSSAAKDGTVDGEAGLRSCLTALGVQDWLPVQGDVATLDGAPAVIALVDRGSTRTVYAVARTCDAQHPELLAGPLSVP
ncbi:hypothetical protein [Pedococcus dokdonensis]|uniref:hypothetical protein n=1 Tax=Pedococcus dokdonensis TaxID=443156 RepID=UPI0012FDE581|nr:hypothetical protein [Pedococcus dokdonensis]